MKSRKPMQVDQSFEKKLKELQMQIRRKQGVEMSLREITKQITKNPNFESIEKQLIGNDIATINFKLKLDGRLLE